MAPEEKRDTASGRPPEQVVDGAPAPVDPASGQHRDHWVLPEAERAKGFVRPVRRNYRHTRCGTITTMGQPIAETYARQPTFYGTTFCYACKEYLPVGERGDFVWTDDGTKVGT